jgi:hypothetical protein
MDELSLKALVAQQPVTATIGADRRFEDYKGVSHMSDCIFFTEYPFSVHCPQ